MLTKFRDKNYLLLVIDIINNMFDKKENKKYVFLSLEIF